MQVKKQQLELNMEQQTGSKLGKAYIKGVFCHPAYLTYMQSTSCEMLDRLDEAQAGIKNAERNVSNAEDTVPTAESEELKCLLIKVKEESEKAALKLNIQNTSAPITSWQIHRETMKTAADFIFLGSKITADGDCSHEIKRCFLLWKKSYDQLSILKSRDITLLTKVCLVKAYGFSSSCVWMWELDHKEG